METWSSSIDVRRLAALCSTPTYVLSLPEVSRAVGLWTQIVGQPSRIAYPVKANPALPLLKHLHSLGVQAECASEHEVTLALLAGFPTGRIVYNSPAPDIDFVLAMRREGAAVVADNIAVLKALGADGAGTGKTLARVALMSSSSYVSEESWHALTAHADPQGKFGIPLEILADEARAAGVKLDGLHVHAGTMMDDPQVFALVRDELVGLARALRAEGHPIRVLDLGGGLGISFRGNDPFPQISDVGAALAGASGSVLAGLEDAELWVEPGHALVGQAVALLTTVVTTKTQRGRRWAVCDVGSDQLAKVTLLDWRHRILKADGSPLPMDGPDALGGPLCFAGDVLLPHTDLRDVKEGDVLVVQHAGAYCAALENRFNGRLSSAMVVIDEAGAAHIGQKRGASYHAPEVASHPWSEPVEDAEREDLSLEQVVDLSSGYLRIDSSQNNFQYLSGERLSQNQYRFRIKAASPAGFLSAPFALRLGGDAVIVSILHRLNLVSKDRPVWARRSTLDLKRKIDLPGEVVCHVSLSTNAPKIGKTAQYALADFKLNDGEIEGRFEVTW